MGIDSQTDEQGSIQIGPTDRGMVRLYVTGDGGDLPMDFDPDEAEEIAAELTAAAKIARTASKKKQGPKT